VFSLGLTETAAAVGENPDCEKRALRIRHLTALFRRMSHYRPPAQRIVNGVTVHASRAVFCRILAFAASDFPLNWLSGTSARRAHSSALAKTHPRWSIKRPEIDRTAALVYVVGRRRVHGDK